MSQVIPEFSERPDRSEIKDERQRATGRSVDQKSDSRRRSIAGTREKHRQRWQHVPERRLCERRVSVLRRWHHATAKRCPAVYDQRQCETIEPAPECRGDRRATSVYSGNDDDRSTMPLLQREIGASQAPLVCGNSAVAPTATLTSSSEATTIRLSLLPLPQSGVRPRWPGIPLGAADQPVGHGARASGPAVVKHRRACRLRQRASPRRPSKPDKRNSRLV